MKRNGNANEGDLELATETNSFPLFQYRSRVQDLAKRFESNTASSFVVNHSVVRRKCKIYQNSRLFQSLQKFSSTCKAQGTEVIVTSTRLSRNVIRKKSSLLRRYKSALDIVYTHRGVEIHPKRAGISRTMPKSNSEEPISSHCTELLLDAGFCLRNKYENSEDVQDHLKLNETPHKNINNLYSENPFSCTSKMVSSTISSSADLSTSTHHPLRPKQPPPKIPPKPSHLTKPRRTNLAGNNKPIDLMNHQCASIYVSSIKSRDEPSECIASTSETNNVVTVEICDTTTSSVNTGMIKPEVSPKPMPWPRTRPKSISRKPTMKPPPPPVSSAIATLSGKPVHNTITASNSSSNYTSDHNASCNIYQSLSSPESPPPNNLTSTVPVQKSTFVRKGSGFYGKDRRSTPSIPKIPPPSPPKCPMVHSYNDDERFDELYEDIEHSIIMDDEPEAPIQKLPKKGLSSLFYSPKFTKKSEKNHHTNVYRAYSSDTEENENEQMGKKIQDENNWSNTMKRRTHFGTWGKRSNLLKRPPSSGIEFDKLLRIKSEIQLNLSKKVDKIRSKVTAHTTHETSKSEHKNKRSSSVFYVDPRTLQTDSSSTEPKTIEEAIYGDDWSSDEDQEFRSPNEVCGNTSVDAIYQARNSLENNSNPSEHYFTSGRSLPTYGHYELDMYGTYNRYGEKFEQFDSRHCSGQESLLAEIESAYFQAKGKHLPDIIPMSEQHESSVSSDNVSSEENSDSAIIPQQPYTHNNQMDNPSFSVNLSKPVHDLPIHSNQLGIEDEFSAEAELDSLSTRGVYTSRLPEPQPLYQIYMLQEQEKMLEESAIPALASLRIGPSSSSSDSGNCRDADALEADSVCDPVEQDELVSALVRRQSSSVSTDSGRGGDSSSRVTSNTSMRRERLTAASIYGSQRSLWCELAEVKAAGVLGSLDENTKKLQEAFFEVITSEASYLRSINILISNFMMAPELLGTGNSSISYAERKHLFSNITAIRDCSERLLCELENRLEENIILSDVCDILCEHFEKHFDAYQLYCSNQVYQDRILKRLKALNSQFLACTQRIESDRLCQGLDMRSFLMLPMQRVTRYRLLVQAILDRVSPDSPQHGTAARALILANQVVRNCNEGARRMERTEQLLDIERRLVYKSADLKRIPLVTSGRYIVKSGPLMQIQERRSKGILQSRNRPRNIFLFLFSDLILIAKKRPNGVFVCKDYASRRFVVVEPIEPHSHKVPHGTLDGLTRKPHLFLCVLLQNAHGRQVELLLSAESESDRERWLSAMRPPTCMNPDEKIYAEWDCPQAVAVHAYAADQEDELNLVPGDLINILRKMPDGWFYGERSRDCKQGWFPSSYVQQVLNDHVRANNYKQRLRVIEAAAMFRAQQQQAQRMGDKADHSGPNLVNRLRRLSNPKGLFNVSV